jgi:hypothetical protein
MPPSLRNLLSKLTQGTDLTKHEQLLIEITKAESHSIRVLPSDEPIEEYNCVMYALNLVGCLEYPMRPFGHYYIDLAFLTTLVQTCLIRTSGDQAEAGDLVVYYHNGEIVHVGAVASHGRVISKWGCGLLCEHRTWEVPSSYGDDVHYFKAQAADDTFAKFLKYKGWNS